MKPTKIKKFRIADGEEKKKDTKAKKKVMIGGLEIKSTAASLMHLTPYERMLLEIEKVLSTRNQMQIHEQIDDKTVNVAPKTLSIPHEDETFLKLATKYGTTQVAQGETLQSFSSAASSLVRFRSSRGLGLHISLEDIMTGIGTDRIVLEENPTDFRSSAATLNESSSDTSLILAATSAAPLMKQAKPPFIRIILRKTELILLFEQHGITSIKNTEDGNFAENDNRAYDYLTIGRGKIRLRSEAEGQTPQTLYKSREINTKSVQTRDVASYVSDYELFDTYKKLHDIQCGTYEDEPKKLHISHNTSAEEQFGIIAQLPAFQFASVVVKRLLAGNTFEDGQRRFRNMTNVTRTVNKISYKYSLKTLFTLEPSDKDSERRAVADMSFCPANSDILAVAYGIFSHQAARLPSTGEVCIWSIKNPCDPERFYSYSVPVVAVEFSPFIPSLLAIGLYDGLVEVRDIAYFDQQPVASSKRASTPGVDPVLSIKWIKQTSSGNGEEFDPILALSQDGSVTQYRIINSPFLASFKVMSLKRLEGMQEGLPVVPSSMELMQHSNRSPQGLSLIKHPNQLDIYYILTDEGCIHECSINYQHHYLQAIKTHESAVNHMEFSPWSPKLFLTCGNDWCLRIWMEGILEPILTLKNLYQPYNWAAWSRTNSTILMAINRNYCEIWDLKRSTLKPMSSTEFKTQNSTGIFSLDGNSLLIGKERGQVVVNALDEMPFPPHYQYESLEKSIYEAVGSNPDLLNEVKSIGYFGYPNKGFVNPP